MIAAIRRRGVRSFVLGAALGVFSSLASAQVCNPSTPQLDPGTGFVPFGAAEQLLVRGGNSGPAWEWAIGTDTEAGQMAKGSLDWTPGRTFQWTLTYSGTGSATVQVRDQGTLVLSLSYPTGMDAGNALQLQVATNPSIGPDTTVAATVTSLNGFAVSGNLSQTGNNQQSAQNLYYFFPPLAQGFTAQGTVTLSYPAGQLPTGSRVDFLVRSGNIACQGTNQPPTVSLTAPANGTVFTAPANITISANAADADGTVTQVEFYQGATLIGTASAAPYSVNWTNVPVGSYTLTAKATDNQGASTTSAPVSIIVNSPPTVTLTSPASGAIFNAPATINLAATASDTDGSVTKVDFYQGATLIGTATAAPYSLTWTNVAAGSYTLTAVATDNQGAATTSAPVTVIVNAPPTVSLTAPASGAVYPAPATITITANAQDSDGTVTKVDFYQGATLIGTATTAPYSFTWTNVAAGNYTLTAIATDNQGATTTSAAVLITVNAAPTVSITAPASGTVVTAPANLTITASATDPDGTITKVDFYQGATLVGTATTAPYSVTLTNVPAGSYSFTAVATDNQGATATSAPVTVIVNAPPTVSLTSPASGASFTAPATITLAATAADADGTVAKVDFYQGAVLIGTVTAAPFNFTWSNVAAGAYTLTAIATDNQGASTTSTAVAITVNAAPTVSITAPANNALYLAPANITITATAGDADGTVAKVDFYQGATLIGTVTASPYSLTWSSVPSGAYSLTAVATDNAGATTTSSPVTVRVNAAPTVSLTSPVNNATFTSPATINLSASAADTDGTIATVEFYQGATLIATVTAAPYAYTWSNVPPGSYSLSARATDDLGATATSAAVAITVNAPAPQVYYIHPDHLGTPRLVADQAGTTVWRWDQQEPFGNDSPNEDPGSTGNPFSFNFRFPGQYFDRETNLAYNYFRDYDPAIGRYVQPDSSGALTTGTPALTTPLNLLYVYAADNPLRFIDLFAGEPTPPSGGAGSGSGMNLTPPGPTEAPGGRFPAPRGPLPPPQLSPGANQIILNALRVCVGAFSSGPGIIGVGVLGALWPRQLACPPEERECRPPPPPMPPVVRN